MKSEDRSAGPVVTDPAASRDKSQAATNRADLDSIMPQSLPLAAERWAEAGYAVFPLKAGGKQPHPLLGAGWSLHAGSKFVGVKDLAVIRHAWGIRPEMNVGVVTGVVNGLLVIDCDRRGLGSPELTLGVSPVRVADLWPVKDGVAAFETWAEEHGLDLSDVPRVETPGGRHYWWSLTQPLRKRDGWLPGVDVKADGTYVAAAPSVRAEGEYRWAHGDPRALPDAPEALLDAVRSGGAPVHGGGGSPESEDELPPTSWFVQNGFRPGQRNRDAFRLACRLRRQYPDDPREMVADLYAAWRATPQTPHPFPWSEVQRCAESAFAMPEDEELPDWRP